MRGRDALGRTVLDTATAHSVGGIDALVIDPDAARVDGLLVGGRAVSWSDTGGLASDAVTVESADVLRPPTSGAELRAVDRSGDPFGKRLLTEDGIELGTVDDLVIDPRTGAVEAILHAGDRVDGDRLLGIGSFAVVVTSPPEPAGRGGDDGAAGSGPDTPLEDLTRDELYERAQAQDVPGRSSMTKQELIDALS